MRCKQRNILWKKATKKKCSKRKKIQIIWELLPASNESTNVLLSSLDVQRTEKKTKEENIVNSQEVIIDQVHTLIIKIILVLLNFSIKLINTYKIGAIDTEFKLKSKHFHEALIACISRYFSIRFTNGNGWQTVGASKMWTLERNYNSFVLTTNWIKVWKWRFYSPSDQSNLQLEQFLLQ